MPGVPNLYCDALRIVPPCVAHHGLAGGNYLDAIVLALLEHGGPMRLDELVAVLAPHVPTRGVDLRVSIQKAWAGRAPIVKDANGRLALDLTSRRLRPVLVRLGLLDAPPPPPGPPPYVPPGPDVALTPEELRACFWRGVPPEVSGARMAAAVLDATDRPMLPGEIAAFVGSFGDDRVRPPELSRYRSRDNLVVQHPDGTMSLDRSKTDQLFAMRRVIRELGIPRMCARVRSERHVAQDTHPPDARAEQVVMPPPLAAAKVVWHGTVVGVQPRIRLTRSYDESAHSYLGYVLRVEGMLGTEAREFTVAVGVGAHEKHQFRAGDRVGGDAAPVESPDLETADVYKVNGVEFETRGTDARMPGPPFVGAPPPLEVYRARGRRRLAALTYAAKCRRCLWGCEMAVELIIDPWRATSRRYRRETFCYGPKSCPVYAPGPCRRVPGRGGSTWVEEDSVDEDATRHRSVDE